MKNAYFLLLGCVMPFGILAQISLAAGAGWGFMLTENMNGFAPQVQVSYTNNSKWEFGLVVEASIMEGEGLVKDRENLPYVIEDITYNSPLHGIYDGIGKGFYNLDSKSDKPTSFGVFGQTGKIFDLKKGEFYAGAGTGLVYVSEAVVEYILRPSEVDLNLGLQISEPILIPINRYQRFLDVGLKAQLEYRFSFSNQTGISILSKLNWLPASKMAFFSIGALFRVSE